MELLIKAIKIFRAKGSTRNSTHARENACTLECLTVVFEKKKNYCGGGGGGGVTPGTPTPYIRRVLYHKWKILVIDKHWT